MLDRTTFTFLVGILPSSTLFGAGSVKKTTLYLQQKCYIEIKCLLQPPIAPPQLMSLFLAPYILVACFVFVKISKVNEQALAHPYLAQYADPTDEPASLPYDQVRAPFSLVLLSYLMLPS